MATAPGKRSSSAAARKVSKVFNQARASLKVLEALEKETFAKAKTFVRNPLQAEQKDKILASLRSLGVATRAEVEALEQQVTLLTQELMVLRESLAKPSPKQQGRVGAEKPGSSAPRPPLPSAEAFPNT